MSIHLCVVYGCFCTTRAELSNYNWVWTQAYHIYYLDLKKKFGRTSLVVQGLRLHTPNVVGTGSIPVWELRSHMHAATKKSTHRN